MFQKFSKYLYFDHNNTDELNRPIQLIATTGQSWQIFRAHEKYIYQQDCSYILP